MRTAFARAAARAVMEKVADDPPEIALGKNWRRNLSSSRG
jgi:hypothetical protein